ncbi:PTS sugar transporter subunit IIA [Pantoea sp. At-9b]|uniref:PTS sugar transporter subunit IIA n=1 Tax=Pantoea sp. (strain At-9b) TaxID=592316 RepID=UPI0001B3FE98|nr:PTS sugar transporter subunit IIA [Pantoea sp. At-9b]ADU71678.1 phosphoenolpyruvate-dependent sugar phosphotransferase system EIIA 2 [Pantoea sp. At-9b]
MLKLNENDLFLHCQAANKNEAMQLAAAALEQGGYVKTGFFHAMQAREESVSTYIGAGIAFPHCAKADTHLVINTGFQVFQFPQGVSWGAGKVVFIVVAVAAQQDEHIQVLAAIADLLGDEVKTTLLANANTKAGFIEQFEKA